MAITMESANSNGFTCLFAHDVGIGITWFYDDIIFITFEIHGNGVYNCTI